MSARLIGLILLFGTFVTGGTLLLFIEKKDRASPDAALQIASELQRGAIRAAQEPIVLTPEQEREIGLRYLQFVSFYQEHSTVVLYVRDIFSSLLEHLGPTAYTFEIHVSHSYEPNAFALPGGILVINQGMIDLVKHEAELAAVIGHEIMHVHKGHWREALKGRVALEKIGLDDVSELAEAIYATQWLGFSEAQELEADRAGVVLAANAGYAPRAAELLFQRFSQFEKEDSSEPYRDPPRLTAELVVSAVRRYLASHPPAATRIENIRQTIRDHGSSWNGRPVYWGRRNLEILEAWTRRSWKEELLPITEIKEP